MRTEVHVQNPDHILLPGMYGQVKFQIARSNAPPLIPGDTLVIRSDGPQVALIGPDRNVHFHRLGLGREDGTGVYIISGWTAGCTPLVNPGAGNREGLVGW